jgi:hypothetical protein
VTPGRLIRHLGPNDIPLRNWDSLSPDALLAGEQQDPAAVAESRAGIRLAFAAALQYPGETGPRGCAAGPPDCWAPALLPGPAGPGDQLIAFLGRHPRLRAAPGSATA